MTISDTDIINKYWFFQPDPTLQNNLIAFGFECGPGWLSMINELCEKLDNLISEKHLDLKNDFRVLQVKEKYAGLKFYVSSAYDDIFDLIDEYEDMSYNICEECGKSPAHQVEKHGWIMTRCDECAKILEGK